MPNGRTHDLITLAVTPLAIGGSFMLGADSAGIIQAGIGCMLGLIINPDLDMVARDPITLIFFWPYRAAIAHRNLYSHGPIIGTVGRVGYIYLWLLVICVFAGWPIPVIQNYWWGIGGLALSDLFHILADALV